MKIMLFLTILIHNVLPLSETTLPRIEQIVYQVVTYPDAPVFAITFSSSGTVNLTISHSSDKKETVLNVENGKTYNVIGPSFPVSNANTEYTIYEKESDQTIKVMIEPGISKNFHFDKYNAKNAKTSITDTISIDANTSIRSVKKYSVAHATILNASRIQNRIFDLKRYSIATTNLDDSYINEAYLTSTNADLFDEVFCKSGVCKVPLVANYKDNNITFKLDSNYCYSKSKDIVDRCKSLDDHIAISNVILAKESIGLTSQQMDLVISFSHGYNSSFTYQLKNMSFTKGIYGSCSTSVVCIESNEALKGITYQKEVVYP